MKLLHVDSSILGQGSVSRDLSAEVVATLPRRRSATSRGPISRQRRADISFVRAEGVAMGPEARTVALASARSATAALVA